MCELSFKFGVGDKVMVCGCFPGTVSAVSTETTGSMYRVVWWPDRQRNEKWLHEFELEPVAPEPDFDNVMLSPVDKLPEERPGTAPSHPAA